MSSIVVEQSKAGYEADAAAVRRELNTLPNSVAEQFVRSGVRVMACRGSVVDHVPSLRGVHPRNWPAGQTWDIVPGAYLPKNRMVVIATIAGPAGRIVPPFGSGHGSASLAIHELLHGLDYSVPGLKSGARSFRDAWDEDLDVLGVDYFKHPKSGPEESFAESGARSFGRAGILKDKWPHLRDYWLEDRLEPQTLTGKGIGKPHVHLRGPAGFGRKRGDGSIDLFLTAHGKNGEIGHGMVTIEPAPEPNSEVAAILESAAGAGTGDYDFFDLPRARGD